MHFPAYGQLIFTGPSRNEYLHILASKEKTSTEKLGSRFKFNVASIQMERIRCESEHRLQELRKPFLTATAIFSYKQGI
jgi:hypothetical protein